MARVPPDFSARHSSLGKEYRYSVSTAPVADPFDRHTRLHVSGRMDVAAIRCGGTTHWPLPQHRP